MSTPGIGEANSKADIISELPEEIIENIFLKLPIQDAAKTTLLSKSWRYKLRNTKNYNDRAINYIRERFDKFREEYRADQFKIRCEERKRVFERIETSLYPDPSLKEKMVRTHRSEKMSLIYDRMKEFERRLEQRLPEELICAADREQGPQFDNLIQPYFHWIRETYQQTSRRKKVLVLTTMAVGCAGIFLFRRSHSH